MLEKELEKIEAEMLQHFKDHNIKERYDSIYLSEKDYFPEIDNLDLVDDLEFSKWFYYFQGQYHKIKELISRI